MVQHDVFAIDAGRDRDAAPVPNGQLRLTLAIEPDRLRSPVVPLLAAGLLEATVNKVLHLDANRAEIDTYAMGWKAYLAQRETDERRRKRERVNAETKAKMLTDQANRMRAKASKASAAQSMLKRAEKMVAGLESERKSDKVARIKFPAPAPCASTNATLPRSAGGSHRRTLVVATACGFAVALSLERSPKKASAAPIASPEVDPGVNHSAGLPETKSAAEARDFRPSATASSAAGCDAAASNACARTGP